VLRFSYMIADISITNSLISIHNNLHHDLQYAFSDFVTVFNEHITLLLSIVSSLFEAS
jgi:hypothetical protein